MATIGRLGGAALQANAGLGTPAERFLMCAMRFMGQPYQWGGGHGAAMKGPGPVDCSGLVQQAAQLAGLDLSGTAATQQDHARPITKGELRPGDLVFRGDPAHHVGIYLGDGKVLHAPKTGDVVRITGVDYFDHFGRPQPFEGGRPVAPVAPAEPAPGPAKPAPRPWAPPVAPGLQPGLGEPSAIDLPRGPLRAGDPVPAYAERFGRQGYVRDGSDGSLLELARRAVAKAPQLAGTGLAEAVQQGHLGREDVRELQRYLEAQGFSVGDTGVDGLYGPRTHHAMEQFLAG